MQIDIEKLIGLVSKADKIFLSKDGETVLVELLTIQKQVEEAIEAAKKRLEDAGKSINPNFMSIQGDKIKVYYRAFGQRFYVDEEHINEAPKELYSAESKIVYKVDSKLVEKWVEEKGGMPTGIREVERNKSIVFKLKNDDTHE